MDPRSAHGKKRVEKLGILPTAHINEAVNPSNQQKNTVYKNNDGIDDTEMMILSPVPEELSPATSRRTTSPHTIKNPSSFVRKANTQGKTYNHVSPTTVASEARKYHLLERVSSSLNRERPLATQKRPISGRLSPTSLSLKMRLQARYGNNRATTPEGATGEFIDEFQHLYTFDERADSFVDTKLLESSRPSTASTYRTQASRCGRKPRPERRKLLQSRCQRGHFDNLSDSSMVVKHRFEPDEELQWILEQTSLRKHAVSLKEPSLVKPSQVPSSSSINLDRFIQQRQQMRNTVAGQKFNVISFDDVFILREVDETI